MLIEQLAINTLEASPDVVINSSIGTTASTLVFLEPCCTIVYSNQTGRFFDTYCSNVYYKQIFTCILLFFDIFDSQGM